jgi:hypothetical protein
VYYRYYDTIENGCNMSPAEKKMAPTLVTDPLAEAVELTIIGLVDHNLAFGRNMAFGLN